MEIDYRESDLKYIKSMAQNPDPVVTSMEVADELDISQQAAHKRLSDMEDRGLVVKKKVGSRAVIWWLSTFGKRVYKKEFR